MTEFAPVVRRVKQDSQRESGPVVQVAQRILLMLDADRFHANRQDVYEQTSPQMRAEQGQYKTIVQSRIKLGTGSIYSVFH